MPGASDCAASVAGCLAELWLSKAGILIPVFPLFGRSMETTHFLSKIAWFALFLSVLRGLAATLYLPEILGSTFFLLSVLVLFVCLHSIP